ncbi:MAG TPA: hypothetical protein VNS60_06355 [Solirubrobacterales bacterium]|nr:hypothetical protein [Solirubrobacterales bacterium]
MALLVATMAAAASSAWAGPGYGLESGKSSINLAGEVPHGIAIDQVSQDLYVTVVSEELAARKPGYVAQFDASGEPTEDSPFRTGGEDLFAGVAVNPVTEDIYAYQTVVVTEFGSGGTSKITSISPSGVAGASFTPSRSRAPQLAADASGRVYFPNDIAGSVQVFTSSGELKETILCTGCPGGAFVEPNSAAIDSTGNLYVTDLSGGGRAIKFKRSGGAYVYDSVLQSGEGAAAVGVDPSNDGLFVGDLGGGNYHIAAYDSSGVQFDDFGAGIVGTPTLGSFTAGQLAVNATTHKLYVTDPNARKVWIFKPIASVPPPTATTSSISPSSQVETTLKATVNPLGHGITDCHFQYTDAADFGANGFANATSLGCTSTPNGSTPVQASRLLTGLSPGATYDYRIVVAGYGGTAEGSAQAFTMLPPLAPDATTGSATEITKSAATLRGTVNARGGPISNCHFEYTTSADFEASGFTKATSIDCLPKPNGTSDISVSAKVASLTAGTSYRFRVLATNNSGPTQGLDQPFATPAETCENTPALCPPPVVPPTLTPTSTPTAPASPPPAAHKPLKCHKGFKKKTVHGKPKCVKLKKHPKRRGH